MKNIDNDMDELFNKAGHDYPLNTEKKNWKAVSDALQEGESITPAAKKRWYRYLLPFLLLISVPVVMYLTEVGNGKSESESQEPDNARISLGEAGSREPGIGHRSIGEAGSREPEVESQETGIGRPSLGEAGNQEPIIKSREPGIGHRSLGEGGNKASDSLGRNDGQYKKQAHLSDALNKSDVIRKRLGIGGNRKQEIFDREAGEEAVAKTEVLENFFRLPETFNVNNIISSPSENLHQPIRNTTVQLAATTTSTKSVSKKTKGFYYGLVAAADVSTIKLQEVTQPGSSVGILAGYQLNPHWSVELSGKWSTKKYYSEGKYFDKTGANIPDYVQVHDVTGGCNMFEIPLNVRYLFSPGKNSFFTTAGVTSYFMNKESYDYTADAGGMIYEGYRNYKNSGNHLFSNLQLTGGYQFKLFPRTNLRIEPYVLLPLKKVGVGKMPITSAGVQVGLMRITR